ncbi:MAG TPA: biotin--[acetyl-CoA-carboxylase] ligase [Bacillota bacterium]
MEQIIQILKANQGEYVSGEQLAQSAGITRAGVWKQISRLREIGYLIEAAPRRGYKLLNLTKALHPFEIKAGLQTKLFGQTIDYHKETGSTNLQARKLAAQGATEGTIVLAESQTSGRGRLGRTWSSRPGLGLWFSLILRPRISTAELAVITVLTAVTLSRAIYRVTGIQVQVKWPNDLMYHGAKLAGILAELNGEMDRVNYLIIGIGLNVNHGPADFPLELRNKATSLRMIKPVDFDRKKILQRFLEEFEASYFGLGQQGQIAELIDYARQHSATLGRQVTINQGFGKILTGTALDLDWDGSLWLKNPEGQLIRVYSGEIIEASVD